MCVVWPAEQDRQFSALQKMFAAGKISEAEWGGVYDLLDIEARKTMLKRAKSENYRIYLRMAIDQHEYRLARLRESGALTRDLLALTKRPARPKKADALLAVSAKVEARELVAV